MTTTLTRRARELPETGRDTGPALSTAEYTALVDMVNALEPDDWGRPTDCAGWTVRDIVAHLAGAAEGAARLRVQLRHQAKAAWQAARGPLEAVDYMCRSQIADRAAMSDAEVAADLRRWAPLATAGLAAVPSVMRRIPLPKGMGLRRGARLAYFIDIINTRDVWLHRVDLARATGRPRPASTADADVIRQVVRDLDIEWTGPTLDLALTGATEETFRLGGGAPVARVTEDAIAFMRLLSGRSDECSLITEGDSAATAALRPSRVVF